MKVDLSKKDIELIKLSLYFAQEWEESLVQAHECCKEDWPGVIKRAKNNVKEFRRIQKQLMRL